MHSASKLDQSPHNARELVALAAEALTTDLVSGRFLRGLFGRRDSAAMATLAERLEKMNADELSRLDPEVREISYYGASDGWSSAQVRRVGGFGQQPHAWAILGFLTFHRDGHMRQSALQALGATENPKALLFILLRLNDWVPQVRDAAKSILPVP